MLRERTGSADANSFKRYARLTGICLALAGLAACGGGGGGGSSNTATLAPEMTITPSQQPAPPASFATDIAEAQTITSGEEVEGTLASANDVKYYRLVVEETSNIELTIDAEQGTEIALMDRQGRVFQTARTESVASASVVAPAGEYYVRVRVISDLPGFRPRTDLDFQFSTTASAPSGIYIDLRQLLPKFLDLEWSGDKAAYSFMLSDHFVPPEGFTPRYSLTLLGTRIRGVNATISDGTLHVRYDDELRRKDSADPSLTPFGTLSGAVVAHVDNDGALAGTAIQTFSVHFGFNSNPGRSLRVKEQYAATPAELIRVPPGQTRATRNLEDYFEYTLEAPPHKLGT